MSRSINAAAVPAVRAWPRRCAAAVAGAAALTFACQRPDDAARPPRGEVAIGMAFNPARPGMDEIVRGVTLATEALARDSAARASGLHFVPRRAPRALASAVEIATALRDDPTVVGIVGDAESGRTLDAIPVLEDLEHAGANAVVAVSPTATSPALTGRSAWVFRVTPNDVAISQATAAYLADSLGARRAAVVYRNDSYGRDWAATFVRAFRQRGGTVVQRDPYLAGITEWDAIASYTARALPDVVLFPGSAEDAADYIRALRVAGVTAPFIGGDAVAPLAAQPEFAGIRYATPYAAEHAPHTPVSADFVAAYRARWRETPTARAALSYDATLVLARAVLAVGPDRARVRAWVAALGTTHPAIPGATGALSFDSAHDARDRAVTIATVAGPRVVAAAPSPRTTRPRARGVR
jgi:branched-chain amino acid transport system substrate-binding protein